MRSLVPRRLIHRGTWTVEGWWLHHGHLGPAEFEARAIALAAAGATLLRLGEDRIALLPRPTLIDTRGGPGTPLVRIGHALSSVPLSEEEAARLVLGPRTLVLGRGGRAELLRLDDLEVVPTSEWLTAGPLTMGTLTPLGEAATPLVLPQPTKSEVREVLGMAPAGPPGARRRLLAALAEDAAHGPAPGGAGGLLDRLRSFWRALFSKGSAANGRPVNAASGATQAGATADAGPEDRAPPRPGLLDRLRQAVSALVLHSRLLQLFSRRQAQYLSDMLSAFERGDLDQALKSALPLSDLKRPERGPPSLALGVPTPRADLSIDLARRHGGRSTMVLADELYAQLEAQYRRAFERLDREGRIEEAAFVLTELLQQHEEAVDYLERHGRYPKAAELAEARGLWPGLIIRLWVLAGDWERALRVAINSGAFADAILRLERTHAEEARRLRRLWAYSLAEAGELPLAIDVLWPLVDERQQARGWVEVVLASGGAPAARMLLRAFELDLLDFAGLRDRAVALLESEGPAELEGRAAFTQALLSMRRTSELSVLARPALRALYRDALLTPQRARLERKRLESMADDPVLRADLPSLPNPSSSNGAPQELHRRATDRGAIPALDVARLDDGRLVVAFGERGVGIYDLRGKLKLHFDEPAHHLVPADRGARLIGLAPRDAAFRLTRFDLVHQRASHWATVPLTAYAPTFDGWRWFVSRSGRTVALDAMRSGLEVLWSLDLEAHLLERAAPITYGNRTEPIFERAGGRETRLRLLAPEGGGLVTLAYEGPDLRLDDREEVTRPPEGREVRALAFSGGGELWRVDYQHQEGEDDQGDATTFTAEWSLVMGVQRVPLSLPAASQVVGLAAGLEYAAITAVDPFGTAVRLVDRRGVERWAIHLEDTRRVRVRFFGPWLLLGDSSGRVLLLDTRSVEVVSSFLISA